jgi:hypothetical protein
MLGRIAKFVGYTKAPKATYMLRHPVKGAIALRASRRGLNRAAVGAGAAALALPLGWWLLKRRGADPAAAHLNSRTH